MDGRHDLAVGLHKDDVPTHQEMGYRSKLLSAPYSKGCKRQQVLDLGLDFQHPLAEKELKRGQSSPSVKPMASTEENSLCPQTI